MSSRTVAGLFAGIGGLELGLANAGFSSEILCEIDPAASAVLRTRFPDATLVGDIRGLRRLPDVDLVTAGFPCQDLSQAGQTRGITGLRSGLVAEVFRLLQHSDPTWLLLENVSFMLQLGRGAAMRHITSELAALGFGWAYRVVDTRAFGLPQRRQRVYLVASRTRDPRSVLLVDDAGEPDAVEHEGLANGFYWTEGVRGLGWAVNSVPTLKGGSTLGIPSPPAIWMPDGRIVTPDIRDAERLQGFRADWTLPSIEFNQGARSQRWRLVGNAVSVPVAKWVGDRLNHPKQYDDSKDSELSPGSPWPSAAWGFNGKVGRAKVSMWPVRDRAADLGDFLEFPVASLSTKATEGFLSRTQRSNLRFPRGFIDALTDHLRLQRERLAVA